jgi:hypothetical protein
MRHILASCVPLALLLCSLDGRAHAESDLDGDWQIGSDVFLRCARSGSEVSCLTLPTLLALTGTTDVGTGDFTFAVPPVPPPPGSGSVPPGPDGSFTGTVAADGQVFTATLTLCSWQGTLWQCSAIPFDGVRFTGPPVCGNAWPSPASDATRAASTACPSTATSAAPRAATWSIPTATSSAADSTIVR